MTVLKDGQLAITTIAGPDSRFEVSFTGLSSGSYIFAVYSEDEAARRSSLFTFPVTLSSGAMTNIGGIFLSPTIAVDKSEVKQGENIAIFGQTVADSVVTLAVNSEEEIFVQTLSDNDGVYLHNFDTTPLALGDHSTKSKAAITTEISPFSPLVGFRVGVEDVPVTPGACPLRGDLNSDCRVNLIDFSIAAFWYRRPLDVGFLLKEKEKLNGDGRVDLVDFSIMAYYWTG